MSNRTDASNENNTSRLVTQKHNGAGDNVLGNKTVFQAVSVSPVEIQNPIRGILTSLRHRQSTQAKKQLETLSTTSNLNADATSILNIISILIKLAEDNSPSSAYQQLSTYLGITTNGLCIDIAISTQIRLDAKNENLLDARERYMSKNDLGAYSKEVFYEFIADECEIKKVYETRRWRDAFPKCGHQIIIR